MLQYPDQKIDERAESVFRPSKIILRISFSSNFLSLISFCCLQVTGKPLFERPKGPKESKENKVKVISVF